MKAIEQSYNLPGYGVLRADIYPHTQVLQTFLEKYGFISRFQFMSQLGALRNIFHGAHHSRYEYIFVQWAIICALKKQNKVNLSLSTNTDYFGSLPGLNKFPTYAELLQCIVILTNMGHLPETFSASRTILHLLKTNQRFKTGYKDGLTIEGKVILNEVIDNNDIYKIHLLNALFLLQRYRRLGGRSVDYVSFCTKLLQYYLKPDSSNYQINRTIELSKKIRQLAFLVLDSHYTPTSFSLDLSSIMLNFDQSFEEVLINDSSFKSTMKELEKVLQDQVYLEGNSLLATSQSTEGIIKRFNNIDAEWSTITAVKGLLEPYTEGHDITSTVFHNPFYIPEPDWHTNQVINLSYTGFESDRHFFPNNAVEWENEITNELGKLSYRVGAQYNPSQTEFNVAFGINKKITNDEYLGKIIRLTHHINNYHNSFPSGYVNPRNKKNQELLFKSLLSATFGLDKRFILEPPVPGEDLPLFFERGVITSANKVKGFIDSIGNGLNEDQLHELNFTEHILRTSNYRGQVVTFIGATKILKPPYNDVSAEFDGVIFLPSRSASGYFALIIEAKNIDHAHTAAKNQLEKRLKKICPDYVEYDITEVQNLGAYASLKIKQ